MKKKMIYVRIAKVLKDARRDRKMNQDEFSKAMGINKTRLHRIESGRFEATLSEAQSFYKVTGIGLWDYVEET